MSQRVEPIFPPTTSFLSIKMKDFDRDKCAPAKLFIVANVAVTRSVKHHRHRLLPGPQRNRVKETFCW